MEEERVWEKGRGVKGEEEEEECVVYRFFVFARVFVIVRRAGFSSFGFMKVRPLLLLLFPFSVASRFSVFVDERSDSVTREYILLVLYYFWCWFITFSAAISPLPLGPTISHITKVYKGSCIYNKNKFLKQF